MARVIEIVAAGALSTLVYLCVMRVCGFRFVTGGGDGESEH